MFGLLNINKPAGWTSRDVVNRVHRNVRPAKAGHAGTLDPLATGVLIVCIGPATRLIEHVQRMPKRYRATFLLGRRSPSDDTELEVEVLADAPVVTRQQVETALPPLVGEIQQTPPAYSAVNIDGRKAYQLARKGHDVRLAPRPVTVHSIEVVSMDYPQLVLDIHCGSGTYVRALGRDLAASLGTAAVMSALERTAIGVFRVEQGIGVDELSLDVVRERLIGPTEALGDTHIVTVTEAEEVALRSGMFVARDPHPERTGAAVSTDGRLVALLIRHAGGKWQPRKVFADTAAD